MTRDALGATLELNRLAWRGMVLEAMHADGSSQDPPGKVRSARRPGRVTPRRGRKEPSVSHGRATCAAWRIGWQAPAASVSVAAGAKANQPAQFADQRNMF